MYGLGQGNHLYGGDGNDTLTGGSIGLSGNELFGEAGDDLLVGGGGAVIESLYGDTGDDVLDSRAGNDYVFGGSGSNTVIFGAGYGMDRMYADRPSGGTDVQTIQLTGLNPGDVLLRQSSAEYEFVDTLVIYVLNTSDQLSVVNFFYPDSFGSTDRSVDQIRFQDGTVWNAAAIRVHLTVQDLVVYASDSGDHAYGGAGNDTIYGSIFQDALYGGDGNDLMIGGPGNDFYYVRDALDITTELLNEGVDEVRSIISWTLGDNIENLRLNDLSRFWRRHLAYQWHG